MNCFRSSADELGEEGSTPKSLMEYDCLIKFLALGK